MQSIDERPTVLTERGINAPRRFLSVTVAKGNALHCHLVSARTLLRHNNVIYNVILRNIINSNYLSARRFIASVGCIATRVMASVIDCGKRTRIPSVFETSLNSMSGSKHDDCDVICGEINDVITVRS